MMIVFRLQMFRNTLWKRLYRPFKVNTEIYNTLLPSVSLLTFRHPLTTACTRGRLGSLKYRMYSCAIIVHVNHKWGLLSSSPTIIPFICHRHHRRCLCKKKLPGVNFYRFNAKNWRFFYRFNAKNWRFSV